MRGAVPRGLRLPRGAGFGYHQRLPRGLLLPRGHRCDAIGRNESMPHWLLLPGGNSLCDGLPLPRGCVRRSGGPLHERMHGHVRAWLLHIYWKHFANLLPVLCGYHLRPGGNHARRHRLPRGLLLPGGLWIRELYRLHLRHCDDRDCHRCWLAGPAHDRLRCGRRAGNVHCVANVGLGGQHGLLYGECVANRAKRRSRCSGHHVPGGPI